MRPHANRGLNRIRIGRESTRGANAEQALALGRAAVKQPMIEFNGLMTYPTSRQTAGFLQAALPLFSSAGIEIQVISGGGTPDAYHSHQRAPVNELRAGTYIYNDRMMIAAQAATLADCALTVHATVVSRPDSE